MRSRQTAIAVVLSVVMVMAAGCAGWGTDDPADPGEESDGNGEAQAEEDPVDDDEGAEEPEPADGEPVDEGDPDEHDGTDPPGAEADADAEADVTIEQREGTDVHGDDGGEAETLSGDGETHTLTVTIVDATAGGPIEGTVTIDGETRETDADHGAEFELEDGAYTVAGEVDDDWYVESEEVTVDGEERRIVLSANPIRALSVDVGEGDVGVTLVRDADGATTTRTSGDDGTVDFSVVPGSYTLSADGYETADVVVPADRDPETVEMDPVDEETYTLTVEATAPVTLERTWEDASTTREPTDGTVEFTVVEGEYTLSAEGYHDVPEELALHVDEDTTVALQSYEGAVVEVNVVDAETGEGIEGADVSGVCDWYYSAGDDYLVGETDASGVAQAESGLTPTTCDTAVEAAGYEPEHRTVNVPEDDGMTVELEPETNTLTVAVTDAGTGEPIEGATVEAFGADGDPDDTRDLTYEAETDGEGVAEMEVVAAMNYGIVAEAEGYESGSTEVSLDRETEIELTPEDGGGENGGGDGGDG